MSSTEHVNVTKCGGGHGDPTKKGHSEKTEIAGQCARKHMCAQGVKV